MENFEITLADNVQGIGVAGQRVTLSLTPADVHDPTELPDYLAGYNPFSYRADDASPVVPVNKDEDKYRSFSEDDAFEPVKVKGSTSGAVPEVDPRSSLDTYKVVERYVGSFVPTQTRNQADYNIMMAAGRRCMRAVQLDREIEVFTTLGTAGTWAAGQTTPATAVWTDQTTGDPILDVQTLMEKSAQQVTAYWMNQKIANRFLRHTKVREHMRQFHGDASVTQIASNVMRAGQPGVVADFAIPGFAPFKVVASKYKNAAGALVYTMPDVCIGVTTPAGVPDDGEEIATTYTFRRRGPSGVGINTREFEVPGRGPEGGTMLVVNIADIPIITANNAGGIITGV